MKLTTAIVIALSAFVAAQDFAFSCDHNKFEFRDGHNAKAKCGRTHGGSRTTTLDLDRCFINDNGALRRDDRGKYSKSCVKCQMNPNRPSWMWCQCKDKSKNWKESEINLNDYLANQDGKLCCGNSCGTE
ncbi:uncharacterized protein DNG_03106 [Cephalotrichum gorgonifer]|uniref:Cyanovirin-N domain-containing protein n=1 Tax=Cephalotrichum gorgonifer TaxID=2041049 RepID=A0AAE8STB7_9PEZI|nr:uncharacterized protein DNG_03106 [Cephalotrichum gorgonifer]